MRNYVWADDVRLFQDAVSKSPRKDRAINSLVWSYYKKGRYDEAIKTLEDAMKVLPEKRSDFSNTLGNLYLKTERFDKAVELFKERLPYTKPRDMGMAYNNLGVAYLYMWNKLNAARSRMPEEEFAAGRERILAPAAEAFQKSMDVEDLFGALDSYVNVASYRGKEKEVEEQARSVLAEKEDFESLYIIGKLAFLRNDFATADEFFERAEKTKSEKLVYFNHGYALDQLGQKDRAIEKYIQAIRIDPIFIEAHHNVALIYMGRQDFAKAIDHFSEVLRYDPNHVTANVYLARIYAAQGDKVRARKFASAALAASPGNQLAIQTWQELGL